MKSRILIAFIYLLLIIPYGCIGHGQHGRFTFGMVFAPVVIRDNTEKIYIHDEHIHDEFCGHPKKWYNGKWVYYYNGRWEYYDYNEKVYYYIPSELVENAE